MYIATHARTQPDRPAIVMVESGIVVTFAELDRDSTRLARAWRAAGLVPGDRVAILTENRPEFFTAAWAAQRSGLYYVPINWHLTAAEMEHIVRDSGSRALFASAPFTELAAHLAAGDAIRSAVSVGGEIPGFDPLDAVLAAQSDAPLDDELEGSEMVYSSGTSGQPKGGRRPLPGVHPDTVDPGRYKMVQLLGLDEPQVTFLTPGAPLYHAAPLRYTMRVSRLGGTNVVMERFDPEAGLRAIEAHRITHSQWVPTMFIRMLRLDDGVRAAYDLSSQRSAFHAAAPCPRAIKAQMLDWWGPIIHEYYGGSEGGIVTYISPHEWLAHPGSVGRPVVGKLHIVGDDGREAAPGEPGLVCAEDGAPIDYLNDPAKTAAAHDERGWATVGDIGYVDDEGYLFLTDRRDHMIISGGVNIYPQEVEDVLVGHPAVADVAVLGVPHDELGEEVKAVVQLTDAHGPSDELAAALIELCRSSLAGFKCPRSVDFVEELPRAPSGKLYKRRLREEYWKGHASLIG